MTQPLPWPCTGDADPLFEPQFREAVVRVREHALSLAGTGEKIMRGHIPTITAGGKNFCIFWRQDGRPNVCLNAGATVQDVLKNADPERYFVPAYMGPRGWIGVRLDGEVDWGALIPLVEEAHGFAAPPRKAPRKRPPG